MQTTNKCKPNLRSDQHGLFPCWTPTGPLSNIWYLALKTMLAEPAGQAEPLSENHSTECRSQQHSTDSTRHLFVFAGLSCTPPLDKLCCGPLFRRVPLGSQGRLEIMIFMIFQSFTKMLTQVGHQPGTGKFARGIEIGWE